MVAPATTLNIIGNFACLITPRQHSTYGAVLHEGLFPVTEMDARARKKEKQKLFTELYRLDNVDNIEAEASPLKVFAQRPTAERLSLTAKAFKRTVSAPVKAVSTPNASISMVENTSCHSPLHLSQPSIEMSTPRPLGPLSKSFPAPETRMPSTKAKRKRSQSLDDLPDSEKIFTGLSFCKVISRFRWLV